MRSRTAIWFEAKVRYDKAMENGDLKKVTETYVVDALSFGEAEKRAIEEITPFVNDGLEIADLKIAQYKEVFFADNQQAAGGTWQSSRSSPSTRKPTRRRRPGFAISSMLGISMPP